MPLNLAIVVLLGAGIVLGLVALVRAGQRSRREGAFDAGSVSTRWLSEQRRDEPWTGR